RGVEAPQEVRGVARADAGRDRAAARRGRRVAAPRGVERELVGPRPGLAPRARRALGPAAHVVLDLERPRRRPVEPERPGPALLREGAGDEEGEARQPL